MSILSYNVRLAVTFISRFKVVIALGTVLGIFIFFLLRFIIPVLSDYKVETIGMTGRFQKDTLPNDILEMIGDGLTSIDMNGLPIPNLAASWETLDQGTTWTFHLKDIQWHDGKKLESGDINYSFQDVEINRPDDHTIVFKLQEKYSPLPVILSKPVFKKGLLGTGEWKVSKISVVGQYIQKITLVKGREKIIYRFYPTEEQTKLAYKLGEIKKVQDLSSAKPFDTWINSKVEENINTSQVIVIFLNLSESLISEKAFRQALNYAIDKDNYGLTRAISPIQPDSFYYNSQVKRYNYDLDKAKGIISDLPKELKDNLSIKLVSTPGLLGIAEKIVNDWSKIGVNTDLQVTSVVPQDYQAFITTFNIPDDPDQYSLWHSAVTETNITKYKNPRIDKLLEDGRLELNQEERKKIYFDFQKFLLEDSPAVFLFHPVWYNIIRK